MEKDLYYKGVSLPNPDLVKKGLGQFLNNAVEEASKMTSKKNSKSKSKAKTKDVKKITHIVEDEQIIEEVLPVDTGFDIDLENEVEVDLENEETNSDKEIENSINESISNRKRDLDEKVLSLTMRVAILDEMLKDSKKLLKVVTKESLENSSKDGAIIVIANNKEESKVLEMAKEQINILRGYGQTPMFDNIEDEVEEAQLTIDDEETIDLEKEANIDS